MRNEIARLRVAKGGVVHLEAQLTGELANHLISGTVCGRSASILYPTIEEATCKQCLKFAANAMLKTSTEDAEDAEECDGHESLAGDSMGLTVYCDGSCAPKTSTKGARVTAETITVGTRVTVDPDYTDNSQPLSGTVIGTDGDSVIVEHAEGCAPLAYSAQMLTRDPSDEEFPNATCVYCEGVILWVHGMWINRVGNDRCIGYRHGGHVPADVAQDALEAEQQRTGTHAGCGLPMAEHCAPCDVCPTDRERCQCGPELTIGAIDDDELTVLTMAPYDGPDVIHTVPTPTADDIARMADPVAWARDPLGLETLRLDGPSSLIPPTERQVLAAILDLPRVEMITSVDAARWQLQRARYALRVANGTAGHGTQVHAATYSAMLTRGYPKRKASKTNRKGW